MSKINNQTYKNNYFALRHAKSTANEKGIIVSNPENGINDYGLSEKGIRQCEQAFSPESILKLQTDSHFKNLFAAKNILCITSPFLRTVQTAKAFTDSLKLKTARTDDRLRERDFGDLELSVGELYYNKVWDADVHDENNNLFSVESPLSVRTRLQSLIDELENQYKDKTIILVSHGDTLQILQTIFENISCTSHRSLKHLQNAELRLLNSRLNT